MRGSTSCNAHHSGTMMTNAREHVLPRRPPPLDAAFRPASLALRAFDARVRDDTMAQDVVIAVARDDDAVSHFSCRLLRDADATRETNATVLERYVKFLLWSRGGWRVEIDGIPCPGRFSELPHAVRAREAARTGNRGRKFAGTRRGLLTVLRRFIWRIPTPTMSDATARH